MVPEFLEIYALHLANRPPTHSFSFEEIRHFVFQIFSSVEDGSNSLDPNV